MALLALVDMDLVAYPCAASAENEPEGVAELRADTLMRNILAWTEADEYKGWLTGTNNFRYEIYPEYKANRKDKPKPKYLQDVREFLVTEWNAIVTDGVETDDELARNAGEGTIICSFDKDMYQVPGNHFNWNRQEHIFVTIEAGYRHFYKQMILGDRSDNIPGYDGTARDKIPKFLDPQVKALNWMLTEEEMFKHVWDMYEDKEAFLRNGKLLYIGGTIWNGEEKRDMWIGTLSAPD